MAVFAAEVGFTARLTSGMHVPHIVVSIALIGIVFPVRAPAQDVSTPAESSYKEWLTLNVGAGPPDDVHFGVSYNFGWRHFFQVAVNHNEEFNILGAQGRGETALNVSVGSRVSFRHAVASVFVGPAVIVAQNPQPELEQGPRFTAGVIANPQMYLRPFVDIGTVGGIPLGGLGFGLDLLGSANPIRSSFGVRLGLYLGTSH